VETTHPGNIGACARAMKTMGISSLRLVSPRQFPSAEVTARAAVEFITGKSGVASPAEPALPHPAPLY